MKDRLRLELAISRSGARAGLVAALLVAGTAALQSEQLTLTTTYPSPIGVYSRLITTGRSGPTVVPTLLARDAGSVVVGGTAAPAGVKLHVGGPTSWGNIAASSMLQPDQGGSIELGAPSYAANLDASGTPYIDFHHRAGGAEDYNVRIINDSNHVLSVDTAGGRVRIAGGLQVQNPSAAAGRVLTAVDADGNAVWRTAPEPPFGQVGCIWTAFGTHGSHICPMGYYAAGVCTTNAFDGCNPSPLGAQTVWVAAGGVYCCRPW